MATVIGIGRRETRLGIWTWIVAGSRRRQPAHISNGHALGLSIRCQRHFYFPPPGYRGGFDASAGNPITIGATPTQLADDTISGTGTSTRNLDVMLYTVRLGPTLYWDFDEHVGLYAGAGPAVGLVSGSLGYNENITLTDGSTARNHGEISSTGMVYGGYVNATLVYHAVEGGDFYLGAQFMPMSSATISGGGRMGKLDLGGQVYITAGINWPF